MQGYIRVSDASSDQPLKWGTGVFPSKINGTVPAQLEEKKEEKKVEVKTPGKGVGPIKEIKLSPLDNVLAQKGKSAFEAKCVACHKFNERFIGPSLNGVFLRREPEWIMNMMLNPVEMTTSDPTARGLLETFSTQMANMALTEAEARSILEYLRQNDSK
jgi:hypothetical protein